MKKSPQGFRAMEALLILVIVGMIGFVGWYVWHTKSQTDKTLSTATSTSESEASQQYLDIKEWSVKIKMADAAKATYIYAKGGGKSATTGDTIDSSVAIIIKPQFIKGKTCSPGTYITRFKTIKNQSYISKAKKVGNYYYLPATSNSTCSNATDNALATSIRHDYINLAAL